MKRDEKGGRGAEGMTSVAVHACSATASYQFHCW